MGKGRAPCCDRNKVKRGPWTPAEDLRLITFIHNNGHPNWRALPKQAGLLRCGKSCRLRWINYLKPNVKRGNFTPQEEETIINLHTKLGNKWSKIASCLPGRTDNEIKNVWNTHLKKRLLNRKNVGFHQDNYSCKSSPNTHQDSMAKKPDHQTSLLEKISTTPVEPKETGHPHSPASSHATSFSHTSKLDNFSRPDETVGSKQVDKCLSDEKIGIPIDSDDIHDHDFWNVFDAMDPSECIGSTQSNDLRYINPESDQAEYMKYWLRNLENELGLTEENARDQHSNINADENYRRVLEPVLDFLPIWPPSPANFGV